MIADQEIVVDLFAGGGGASQGIRMALGKDPDVAVNHDPIAIAMHQANHPGTWHIRQDIWQVPPKWATKGRPVALLWASPDCTHHSKAKGGPPIRDVKIRDLAWVVEKWAREANPRVIILENVEEFRSWGPLDKDGKIIRSQKGTTFTAFVRSLRRLGYQVQYRELLACDFGAPTARCRLFLIARRDGGDIVWPKPTHGPGRDHPHRAASEIIDWSLPCPSIFERGKPLVDATCRRIANGIMRYVVSTGSPFILSVDHQGSGDGCSRKHDEPLTTITTKNRHALVAAFLAKHYTGATGSALPSPLPTITAVDHNALVSCHLFRQFGKSIGQRADKPVPTIVAGGAGKTGLITSHLVKFKGTSRDGQSLHEPLHTVQAHGVHYAEVRAFLLKYYGSNASPGKNGSQSLHDPLHTITSVDRFGVVTVRIGGEPYAIVDIGMRMLTPSELFRAQGFSSSYVIDIEVNGKPITKRDQVRMVGNSVSPPNAEALIVANLGETGQSIGHSSAGEMLQLNMFADASAGPRH